MNDLMERKHRLVTESESNRGALQQEWRQLTEGVQGELDRLRSPGAWIALALSFWTRPAGSAGSVGVTGRPEAGGAQSGPGPWIEWMSRLVRLATGVIGTWRRILAEHERGQNR
jgi:hypothetical protein